MLPRARKQHALGPKGRTDKSQVGWVGGKASCKVATFTHECRNLDVSPTARHSLRSGAINLADKVAVRIKSNGSYRNVMKALACNNG